MTRAKISQYSATAGDNTDVNGVNIAEGCPPSSMNNMGREIMAALKRFQVGSDGDGVTVGGSLVVSNATTLTTVSATVVQSDTVSEKTSAAGVTVDGVLLKDNGVVTGAGTVSAPVYSTTGDTNTGIFFPAADTIAFTEGGAEAMRLDSSANLQFNSGYGSVATAYGCRAWVNFNGTGTVAIRASGNVSSITDNGTGDYTVNFTTAMPDANYSIVGMTGPQPAVSLNVGMTLSTDAFTPTTSAARVQTRRRDINVDVDVSYALVSVFR